MAEEIINAIEASLPSEVSQASLPEQAQELQTKEPDPSQAAPVEATTPKAEPEKEVPFHEHPRWKEVMQEKKDAQERANRLENQLMDISKNLSTPKEQAENPYEGMDDETKTFWKEVDRRAEAKAKVIVEKATSEERQKYLGEQEQTRAALAVLTYKEFQTNHPDIKPNSPEETAIAEKYKQGYSLEDAYAIVTSPARIKALEAEVSQKKQQTVKATEKIAANMETNTESPNSPVQAGKKLTVREFVENELRKQ